MKIWFKFFFATAFINSALFINTTDYDSDIFIVKIRKNGNTSIRTTTSKSVDNITKETTTFLTTDDVVTTENNSTSAEVIFNLSSNDETTITDSSVSFSTNSEFANTNINAGKNISNLTTNNEIIIPESETVTNGLDNLLTTEKTNYQLANNTKQETSIVSTLFELDSDSSTNKETIIPESSTITNELNLSKNNLLTTEKTNYQLANNTKQETSIVSSTTFDLDSNSSTNKETIIPESSAITNKLNLSENNLRTTEKTNYQLANNTKQETSIVSSTTFDLNSNSSTNKETIIPESSTIINELETNLDLPKHDLVTTTEKINHQLPNTSTTFKLDGSSTVSDGITIPGSSTITNELKTNLDLPKNSLLKTNYHLTNTEEENTSISSTNNKTATLKLNNNSTVNNKTIIAESSTTTNELKTNLDLPKNNLLTTTEKTKYQFANTEEETTTQKLQRMNYKSESSFTNDEKLITENPKTSTMIIDLLTTNKTFLSDLKDEEITTYSSVKKEKLDSSVDQESTTATASTTSELKATKGETEILINSSLNHDILIAYPENTTSESVSKSSATSTTNSELSNRTSNATEEILINSSTNHEIQAVYPKNTTRKSVFNSSVYNDLLSNTKLNKTATNENETILLYGNITNLNHANKEVLNKNVPSTSENLSPTTTENSGTVEKPFEKYYSLLKKTGFDFTSPAPQNEKLEVSETPKPDPGETTTKPPFTSTETTTTVISTTTTDISVSTEEPPTTEKPSLCNEYIEVENLTINPSAFSLHLAWSNPKPEHVDCKFEYLIEWGVETEPDKKEDYAYSSEYTIENLNACELYEISVTVMYEGGVNKPVTTTNTTLEAMKPVENLEIQDLKNHTLLISWSLPQDVANCFKIYRIKKYEDNKNTMNIDYYFDNITFNEVNGCINNTYEVIALSESKSESSNKSYLEPKVNDPPIFNKAIEDDFVITKWTFGNFICRPEKFYVLCYKGKEDPLISVEGEFNVAHNELTAQFDELDPFTTYTCVGMIENMAGNSTDSKQGQFKTKSKPPGVPENLKISEKDKYLNIIWEPPKEWNGEPEKYNLTIEYIGLNYDLPKYCTPSSFKPNIQILNTKDTEYNFPTIIPASKYRISIKAKSNGGWGKEIEKNIDLEERIPDAPDKNKLHIDLITAEGVSSVNISWSTPCNMHGVIKQYRIKLLGRKNNCEPDEREETYLPGAGDNHYKIFQKLVPDYQYLVEVRAENQKNIGNPAENNFKSPAGPPEVPQNVNITEYDNYLNIQWDPPNTWNGKEQNFRITIQYIQLNYNLSKDCTPSSFDPFITFLQASQTEYNFSTIIPASKYRMSVEANSDGGWGKGTEDYFDLHEASPEKPFIYYTSMKSNIGKEYSTSFNVSWTPPCKMNGILEGFHIKLTGERANFESVTKEENIAADHSESYSRVFLDLKPDYQYKLEIEARNTHHLGEIAEKKFVTPAGIPDEPNVDNLKKPDASAATEPWHKAIVYIRNDIFDQSMGDIIYYAIIVATEQCQENPKYELYLDDKWPTISSDNTSCLNDTKAYEATIQRWNPFVGKQMSILDSNEYLYILGEENCTILDYCNRPLEADTKYYVKIRGFTRNGYRDTELFLLQTEVQPSEVPVVLIVSLIVGILAIAFIIAAVLFYTRGKLNIKNWPRMESASQISPAPLPVPIKKFGAHYEKMIENPGKIKNEFQLLSTISSDVTLSTKTALLPVNKKKNRYINILPFDQTRVKLVENANSSDYINASFIKGYSGSNEYIASQGPTEATCPAFWQMILEQNVKLIVMLTQFVEAGKDKCYKYFPDLKEEYDLLNDIKIQCMEEELLNVYNRRVFKVIKENTAKKVTHIQFNLWPDFGVPDEVHHMIDFCEIIKEIKFKKPSIIVMHCSAGVGRTGTLIAFDILLQTIRDKRKVDIFGTVLNLRKQRMTMVQSERQYEFLYKCVYYVINNNKPSISSSKHNLNQISESNM